MPGEKIGIKKLEKRIKEGTIVICETDKSGKIAVMTLEVYSRLGEAHTKGDKTVTWEDVHDAQRVIKSHHEFNPGAETGDRVWAAKELRSTVLPVNSLLVNVHKPFTEEGLPKTRPVCGASSSMNGELLEW